MEGVQIRFAQDTLANWTSANPIIALGEPTIVTDAVSNATLLKIGDGVTAWNSLSYFGGGGGSALWGGIGGDINNQTDLITLIGTKQNAITTGTTAQYFRGDLSLATFPTALSAFSNDVGFITSSALAPYLTSANAALTYVALAGSYADPSWITSLAYSKISGAPSLNFLPLSGGTMSGNIAMGTSKVTGTIGALDVANAELEATNGNPTVKWQTGELLIDDGQSSLEWIARQFYGTWRSNGVFQLASTLAINDGGYKTAISAASSVLGFGTVSNEFTSFDFGNATTRNGFKFTGAASGADCRFEVLGVDTNIQLDFVTKGSGPVRFLNSGGTTRFTIGPSVTASVTFTANARMEIAQALTLTAAYVVAVNGGSTTLGTNSLGTTFEPAALIASHTIVMPSSPANNQVVIISAGANGITAVTHSPNTGQTLLDPLTTLPANGRGTWRYRTANTTWYRIG